MSDRLTVDTITSDQLDALYDRLAKAEQEADDSVAAASRLAVLVGKRSEKAEKAAKGQSFRAEIAETELRTLRAGLRANGADPTQIQNLWAQISLRNRQWRAEKQRAGQAEDLLRVANDTSNKSETERARAVQRAEQAEAELLDWKKLLQKSREMTAAHWAAIARVRSLVAGAADTTSAGISDYDIGRHELARDVLAELDGTEPSGPATTDDLCPVKHCDPDHCGVHTDTGCTWREEPVDTCRPVEVDGQTVLMRGHGYFTPEDAQFAAEIVRAAKRKFEAEHAEPDAKHLRALAFNAVGPALQARGEWLRLSSRKAVANAVLDVVLPTTRITATLARDSEATVQRVIDLYERWNQTSPPLGTSMTGYFQWWREHLAELHDAILPPDGCPQCGATSQCPLHTQQPKEQRPANSCCGRIIGHLPGCHVNQGLTDRQPEDKQEQGAPVDWQAIAKQRERELKTVGAARHIAENRVKDALVVIREWQRDGEPNDYLTRVHRALRPPVGFEGTSTPREPMDPVPIVGAESLVDVTRLVDKDGEPLCTCTYGDRCPNCRD